jgi:hypothetical protein
VHGDVGSPDIAVRRCPIDARCDQQKRRPSSTNPLLG